MENLKYLNGNQAIGDLNEFIKWFKATTPGLENSKVIIAGGSYAGTMAVWMRQVYPESVNGAWASSAPLLAKMDFVGKILRNKSLMPRYQNNKVFRPYESDFRVIYKIHLYNSSPSFG